MKIPVFKSIKIVHMTIFTSIILFDIYPQTKKETPTVPLINLQKGHKWLDNFAYISPKVCQLLLFCLSFATRGHNCAHENKLAINKIGVKLQLDKLCVSFWMLSLFFMLTCWISSSKGNRFSKPPGIQTTIICEFYLLFYNMQLFATW